MKIRISWTALRGGGEAPKKVDKTVGKTFRNVSKPQKKKHCDIGILSSFVITSVITNDVAPFDLIDSDKLFGEMHCLRLLGKGEESALKVEALGCSETLTVVTRIQSITCVKMRCNGVFNIRFWSSTPWVLNCDWAVQLSFLTECQERKNLGDEAEWLHFVLSVKEYFLSAKI